MLADTQRSQNEFLSALSDAEFALLQPQLMWIQHSHGDVLFTSGGIIERAYFPLSGVISMVVRLSEGESVEAGMVGHDGVVGVSAAMAGPFSPNEAIVQIAGTSAAISVAALRTAVARSTTLRTQLHRFDQFTLAQALQSVACMAKHTIEARLCRWLLRSRDLVRSDEFAFTHELLAQMIGATRVSVTLTAKHLHATGLIAYRRGHIRILDAEGLEDISCECYRTLAGMRNQMLRDVSDVS